MSAATQNKKTYGTSRDFAVYRLAPQHPGEILRLEILPRLDMPVTDVARHLGIQPPVLSGLINEVQPVTLDIARRLGKAFGNGARYWLALQMHYDVFHAEESSDVQVQPIATRRAVSAMAGALGR